MQATAGNAPARRVVVSVGLLLMLTPVLTGCGGNVFDDIVRNICNAICHQG